jgi:hypothetical protein
MSHTYPSREGRIVGGRLEIVTPYAPRQSETLIFDIDELVLAQRAVRAMSEPKPGISVFTRTPEGNEAAIAAHGQTAADTVVADGSSAQLPSREAWEEVARRAVEGGRFIVSIVAAPGQTTDTFHLAYTQQLLIEQATTS